jgi:hypothetical protein
VKHPSALVFVLGMLLLAGCTESGAAGRPGSGTPTVVVTKTVTVTVAPSPTPAGSPAGTSSAFGKGEWRPSRSAPTTPWH